MSILQGILLGLVQGVTEFLPISSSGHLVLAEHLLGLPPSNDITFEVVVHLGTLMSVVVAFWPDITGLVGALVRAMSHVPRWGHLYREDAYLRLGVLIVIASVPAAIIGILFEDAVGEAFADPKLVAVMLIVTGLILFLTRLTRPVQGKEVRMGTAILIGFAQAFAILPGISRSGSTISTGMYTSIPPFEAARFSFLLSVPVIAGAAALKMIELLHHGIAVEGLEPMIAGLVMSFLSGYVAIKVLLRIIGKGKFSLFSFYCLVIGILGVLFI